MATDSARRLPRDSAYFNTSTTKHLHVAADLIGSPRRYLASALPLAVDAAGTSVDPTSATAAKWSLPGAIRSAAARLAEEEACEKYPFNPERAWSDVFCAGCEAGFSRNVEDWSHFQALGAIQLVLETFNYLSTSFALKLIIDQILWRDRLATATGEDLFKDTAFYAAMRSDDIALMLRTSDLMASLGDHGDDHMDLQRILDRVAKHMGYKSSSHLHVDAPAEKLVEMLMWALYEATAEDRMGYLPTPGLMT